MKKTILFSALLVLMSAGVGISQTIVFEKKIGASPTADWGKSVAHTSDNGFIISGMTGGIGFGQEDMYLVKTNASGDTLWTRTYGSSSAGEFSESVIETSDGGYALLGYTESYGAGAADIYLIKTDVNGDTLWTKTYGGALNDLGYCIRQTNDGGYILVGSTSSYGNGGYDIYLIKTTQTGDTLWTKTFGGASDDDGYSVIQTSDNGYAITGCTYSFGADFIDGYFIKTDANGAPIWSNVLDGSETAASSGDYLTSVQETSDGGYILTGTHGYIFGSGFTGQIWLVKTNSTGDTLWTKSFGEINADDANGEEVKVCDDGGFAISGSRNTNGNGLDVYLIRTNQNGDSLWTKTIDAGSTSDKALSIDLTNDGAFIVTGYTSTLDDWYQVYLLKIEDSVNTSGVPAYSFDLSETIQIFPNPSADFIYIVFDNLPSENHVVRIYTLSGKLVKTDLLSEGTTIISVQDLENGNYVVCIESDSGTVTTTGLVVCKK